MTRRISRRSSIESLPTGIRTDRYLYVRQRNGEEELYDLAADPRQYVNLAGDPAAADVLRLLRAERARMADCQGPECRAPMPGRLQTAPGESILD